MDARREYLVGLTSVTEGYIDAAQLKEALSTWREHPDRSMAVILTERGWLSEADRSTVDNLVQAELSRQAEPDPADGPSTKPLVYDSDGSTTELYTGKPPNEFRDDPDDSSQEAPAIGPPPDPNDDVDDRYPNPPFHAEGGMKIVFRAMDRKLGRVIALAKLKPKLAKNPEFVRRFVVEARITASLGHPNIVPIHDLNERAMPPSYTMPFLEGRTFAAAIRQHHARKADEPAPEFSLRDLLTSFVGVCNAVAFAHAKGVIHRDLKGANVQIDTLGQTIVLDWGLAHRLSDPDDPLARAADPGDTEDDNAHTYAPTRQGSPIGTTQYMPPEQASGELDRINKLSDVFGLGTMLYFILSGHPPYDSLTKAAAADFPLPSAHKPGIPNALEAICLKAMQAKSEDRYQSAEALAADVGHWLADEPVSVFPEPASVRISRWARKHRLIVAGAAAALIVAVVGLGIGLWRVGIERDLYLAQKIKAQVAEGQSASAAGQLVRILAVTYAVLEDSLAYLPNGGARRLEIVTALSTLANNLEREQGNEVGSPVALLVAYYERHHGNVLRMQYRFSEANDHYNRATRSLEILSKKNFDDPRIDMEQIRVLIDRGELNRIFGNLVDSDKFLEQAVSLARTQYTATTGTPERQSLLASATGHRAIVLSELGEHEAAEPLYVESLTLLEAPPQGAKRNILDRFRGASFRVGLARCVRRNQRPAEAVSEAERALEVAESFLREGNGPDKDPRYLVAVASLERGWALVALAKTPREAIKSFDRAVTHLERLAREFPDTPNYRDQLAEAYTGRGEARRLAAVSELETSRTWLLGVGESDLNVAEELASNLTKEYPTCRPFAAQHARALRHHARVHRDAGRPAEAKVSLGRAIAILTQTAKGTPKGCVLLRELSDCRAELAR